MSKKYNYLFEILGYDENKELYNQIINTTKDEGFYSGNIEIIKQNEKTAMYLAIYFVETVNKYIVYIKDTDKYFKNESVLKEKLSKSNEELRNKELFVANLSHEIKTPINIIVAMIYFLKSTKLDQVQNEYVNRLESSADLLTELVNNILNVTKSDKVTNAINTKEQFVLKNSIDKIYSYIQKPVKPEELKNIIKNIIKTTSGTVQSKQKRETILLLADKIKNWEIIENLNNTFNVICTLNEKDINIISATKKLAAIIIDKTIANEQENIIENSKDSMILYLEYDIQQEKQKNITLTNTEGYIRKIEDIDSVGFILLEMLEKKNKEYNIENTIKGYDNEISEVYKFLYESLVNLTSVRSKETGSHLMRTQEYIKIMIREYEKAFPTGEFESQKKIEDIGIAATLHDIGKVGIPDEILNKPGRLTDEEFEKIKDYTIIGHQILENTNSDKISNDVLEYAKEITLHHHEKYDGTGYPDGLKGEEIQLISRMMAIIDVYDALVNDRVYKKAMTYEDAEEYIISQSGKAFDPKITNVFMNVTNKLKNINEKYKEE